METCVTKVKKSTIPFFQSTNLFVFIVTNQKNLKKHWISNSKFFSYHDGRPTPKLLSPSKVIVEAPYKRMTALFLKKLFFQNLFVIQVWKSSNVLQKIHISSEREFSRKQNVWCAFYSNFVTLNRCEKNHFFSRKDEEKNMEGLSKLQSMCLDDQVEENLFLYKTIKLLKHFPTWTRSFWTVGKKIPTKSSKNPSSCQNEQFRVFEKNFANVDEYGHCHLTLSQLANVKLLKHE